MKLGIVGTRRRNEDMIKFILQGYIDEFKPDMIVSGGCQRGADRFAEELARQLSIPILILYPKIPAHYAPRYVWIQAYYERNRRIAEESDALVAVVADDRRGGTEDTIKWFKELKPQNTLVEVSE